MYVWILLLHSWWRWVVVLTGLLLLGGLVFRWKTAQAWMQHLVRFFPLTLDVQVLLGVVLFALSPLTVQALRSGTLFAHDLARYWSVEHALPMVLALVLAHVGQKHVRAAMLAGHSPSRAGRWLLIGAVLLLLMAIPWPMMPNGRPLFRL
nr:hypothetical protein [Ardenticatena sp.]